MSLSFRNAQEKRSYFFCKVLFHPSKCLGSKDSTERSVTALLYFAFESFLVPRKAHAHQKKLYPTAKTSPTDMEMLKAHKLHRTAEPWKR